MVTRQVKFSISDAKCLWMRQSLQGLPNIDTAQQALGARPAVGSGGSLDLPGAAALLPERPVLGFSAEVCLVPVFLWAPPEQRGHRAPYLPPTQEALKRSQWCWGLQWPGLKPLPQMEGRTV